jgi:hypothetical protein
MSLVMGLQQGLVLIVLVVGRGARRLLLVTALKRVA